MRRLAAVQAEASEAGLFERAPDALFSVLPDGSIARMNRAAELLFGYAREELTGRSIETLVPDHLRPRHATLRVGLDAEQPRPMGAREPLYGRRRDGSTFPVDVALVSVRLDGARVVLAAVRDATRRVRDEEALHALGLARAERERWLAERVSELQAQLEGARALASHARILVEAQHPAAARLRELDASVARASAMVADLAAPPGTATSTAAPAATLGHVLCVDDEPLVLATTVRVLRALGYTATSFGSARAALETFRARPESFDVILADLQMPGMTGLEVARHARAIRGDIRVVVVSGSLGALASRWPPEVHATLAKPFSASAMRDAMASALAP